MAVSKNSILPLSAYDDFSFNPEMYYFVIREFLTKVLRILLNLRGAHMTRIVSSTAEIPVATFLGERITV
jgi:hypothetical protein